MEARRALVLMTDFGLHDRFVASMKGVAYSIDPGLKIFDLTHQVRPYAMEEAAEILAGTIPYWPAETVFVVVVDPGVGTSRKSLAVQLKNDQIIITPDNGTITCMFDQPGIAEIRIIDENIHRREGADSHHTFHGRDIYAYNGARLASGIISMQELGTIFKGTPVRLDLAKPDEQIDRITGYITKIEKPYGNLSTNISEGIFLNRGWDFEHDKMLKCSLTHNEKIVFDAVLPLVKSFGWAGLHKGLIYSDSVGKIGLAINQGNMAKKYKIQSGQRWQVSFTDEIERCDIEEW